MDVRLSSETTVRVLGLANCQYLVVALPCSLSDTNWLIFYISLAVEQFISGCLQMMVVQPGPASYSLRKSSVSISEVHEAWQGTCFSLFYFLLNIQQRTQGHMRMNNQKNIQCAKTSKCLIYICMYAHTD